MDDAAGTTRARQSGFTLVELLVGIAAVLLLMTLLVPHWERGAVHADEAEAIQSLKTLNQMEGQYAASYPMRGFTCTLAQLGGNPKLGAPSDAAAQLIPDDLASGAKAGYHYALSDCVTGHDGTVIAYRLAAVPDVVGKTGDRGFCTDETAAVTFDPRGGAACTEKLQ